MTSGLVGGFANPGGLAKMAPWPSDGPAVERNEKACWMTLRAAVRLIVLFFTRPLKIADFGILKRGLLRRKGNELGQTQPDFQPTQMVHRPGDALDAWGRPAHGIEVSEEPLHTLPADLQEELGVGRPREGDDRL